MGARGKCLFTLAEKKAIVAEAYNSPGMIRLSASKYGVAPCQIRKWKKLFDKVGDGSIQNSRFIHCPSSGRRQHPDLYEGLLEYFERPFGFVLTCCPIGYLPSGKELSGS
uniref:HTH psq-type domain-containing protein n=1 Tax=Spongospora subterranea TaxID=70186 RepID=A0A0H5QVQ9_9EUKA|eukprot:CRZ05991.1 hypothetical protein [Spongospora subterranea]